jgi:hypothetical protein
MNLPSTPVVSTALADEANFTIAFATGLTTVPESTILPLIRNVCALTGKNKKATTITTAFGINMQIDELRIQQTPYIKVSQSDSPGKNQSFVIINQSFSVKMAIVEITGNSSRMD